MGIFTITAKKNGYNTTAIFLFQRQTLKRIKNITAIWHNVKSLANVKSISLAAILEATQTDNQIRYITNSRGTVIGYRPKNTVTRNTTLNINPRRITT